MANIARNMVFKALERASVSTPAILRPVLRPLYATVTKSAVIRCIVWGSTSRDKCHRYWSDPADPMNKPIEYFNGGMINSAFMLEHIRKYADKDASILEIGCNVGRNLWVLHQGGFHNLSGIEINREAVEMLRAKFPGMAKQADIKCGAVESIIREIPGNSYDVVFTMAVLEHIHEDSAWIFGEMARVTRRYIITLEDEVAVSWRTFSRNYRKVFEKVGMRQVEFDDCYRLPDWYGSYKFRVFEKVIGKR